MLDMGFIPDIERIVKMVPFTRQTLFFSATMPPEIERLADMFLHTPQRIEVARPASTASTIVQKLVATSSEGHEKRDLLRRLIRGEAELNNGIIFCNRKRDVALLQKSLASHGFNVAALHGDMDQRARTIALDGVPLGRGPAAGGQRRGGAWPRHPGGEPRLQLRRAASPGRLRAPHRPHRPRRSRRHTPSPWSAGPTNGRSTPSRR